MHSFFKRDPETHALGISLWLEKKGIISREKLYRLKRKLIKREHNMYNDAGEQFFKRIYEHYFYPFLKPGAEILEVGCQYGRFTVDLVEKGHPVMATDIESHYESFIRQKIKKHPENFSFSTENVLETIYRKFGEKFDAIICLEMIFMVPEYESVIARFKNLLKPEGVLIISHRTPGYYTYTGLRQNRLEDLNAVFSNGPFKFHFQSAAELQQLYDRLGYEILLHKGIGMVSGIIKDHWAAFNDAAQFDEARTQYFFDIEMSEKAQQLFKDSGRYQLIIARPKTG